MHNEDNPPPGTDTPLDDENDNNYRQRSRTPTSEIFSHEEERYQRRKRRSPFPRGLGQNAMSRALDQLSKSPFTRRIEGAVLPRRFQQPTFTIYNGNTDPMEHVSQFNQRMVVHSKNEALMCKVFPSSLGPATMKCDGLLWQGQTPRENDDGQPTEPQMENCQEVPNSTGVWRHVHGPCPHQGPDDPRTSWTAHGRPRQRKTAAARNTFKGLRGGNSS